MIFAGPELPGRRRAHQRDLGGIISIGFGKSSPGEQWNAHDLKVVGRDRARP
jgi:hypothetical protein